jgi:adenylyltransferase/sulfurtransferase
LTLSRFPGSPLPEITPTELHARLERGDPLVLVDVRELEERDIADLPEMGQLRIPVGEFLERIAELDPEKEVVLYCRSGSRSGWAARHLVARGYSRIWNLKGGLLGWKNEVDPSIQAY